ncbi:hypothetical protein D3C73_995970 [compost metagenome]
MHGTEDRVRVLQGQIPPQLRALPEHDADLPGQRFALRHRVEPTDGHAPRTWHQDACQHLDGGGLARAVGSYVPDRFPRLHRKVDATDRVYGLPAPPEATGRFHDLEFPA